MADKEPVVGEVYLKDVRLSYPHLHEKQKANEDAKPKYSAVFLIDPSTKSGKANIKKIEAAFEEAEEKAFKKSGMRYKEDRKAYKDGNDQLTLSGEIKDGYEDMMVVSAGNPGEFTRLNKNRKPVDPDNSPFYGGCQVEAFVRFYGTKKGGAPGVFASLEAIRFWGDGESFGSGGVGADAFDDNGDDDDDDQGGFQDDDDDDDGLG
jgi:hypothetical protein